MIVSCFGTAGGTNRERVGREVSIPYSDGMKRFTPAVIAAEMMAVWRWVEKVAIVETIASMFWKVERRDCSE